jgi:hypothetical protein
MRGLPFLHCGTWLYHAARLPLVRNVFHVGGEVDFDNGFRWLAPWGLLRTGKVTVFPAVRRFRRGRWAGIGHLPLRESPARPVTPDRVGDLLLPHREALAGWPLYVSVDKDVLTEADAVVNWDSGRLTLDEVGSVLRAFREAAGDDLAGGDVLGDWSPVRLQGLFRRVLHLTEHPPLTVDPARAAGRNEQTNLSLLEGIALPARDRSVAQPVGAGKKEAAKVTRQQPVK